MLAGQAHAQRLRVVVVPGLEASDLRPLAGRSAVGLIVPGSGPQTSEQAALAMLVRGVVRNSLRGGLPAGRGRIRVEHAAALPSGSGVIVVGLPRGGAQSNDHRYGIAVLAPGYRGLLTSDATRIPGLVSLADVAATALGEHAALGSQRSEDPVGALTALDHRIRDRNEWSGRTTMWLELATGALAVVSGPAAVLGVASVLAANLVAGTADIAPGAAFAFLLAALVAGLGLARLLRSGTAIAAAGAAMIAAYLVSFLVDERWVALSPLGPSQNARFYGVSNLLETLLLVPALAGTALLARRPVAAAGLAALTFLTVAGSRFGADGGGAIVLAVGFAVLAALLAGARRRVVVLAVAAGLALAAAVIGLDALTGASSHVTDAFGSGPGGIASDLWDRVSLSWARATVNTGTELSVAFGLAALALFVVRLALLRVPVTRRALPFAFAAAIAASLVVNDSPKEVTLAGLVGYAAVEALALGPDSVAGRLRAAAIGVLHSVAAGGAQRDRPQGGAVPPSRSTRSP